MASRKKQPSRSGVGTRPKTGTQPGPRSAKKAAPPPENTSGENTGETIIEVSATAVHDTAAEKDQDKTPQSPRGDRLIMAGLGLGVVLSLGLAGYAMMGEAQRGDPAEMIAPLQAQISQLEADLAVARDAGAQNVSRSDLESMAAGLGEEMLSLATAIDSLQQQNPAAAPDLNPVIARIDALETRMDELAANIAAVAAQTEPAAGSTAPAEISDSKENAGWGSFFGDFFRITRIDDEVK